MDKFEVIGYTTAGACLIATLAVFFLWIMPANNAIARDLKAIDGVAGQLKKLKADNEVALTVPDDGAKGPKKAGDIADIIDLSKSLIATKDVTAAALKIRAALTSRTKDLIARVIKAHEVDKPELPVDRLRPFQAIRKDVGDLFDASKVKFEGTASYGLPNDGTTAVTEFQFRTLQVLQQVVTQLFKAGTPITIIRPTVDAGNHNLNTKQEQVTEKVSAVLQFVYYDKDKWAALEKNYRDQNSRAAHLATAAGEPAAAESPVYEKTGFRVVFRTNPVNVSAALASLEQIEGYQVTVKRLEVIRAGLPFYTYMDFEKNKADIPLPYRDGDVQVMAEVELLGFAKGAADEQMKKLYVEAGN